MKTAPFISLFVLLLIGAGLYAQTCGVDGIDDWQKVEVKIMEIKNGPKGFKISGEGIANVHGPIAGADDLDEKELKEIREMAAKNKCCVVYIDVNGLWDTPHFPTMASQNKLYYYYGKQK